MKKIETNERYSYTKLFNARIDTDILYSETVGKDDSCNFILHTSRTINNSSGYGEDNTYYILTSGEYNDYLNEAHKNGLVSYFRYQKLLRETGKIKSSKATTFTTVTLSLSAMRYSFEYELEMKDGYVCASKYRHNYSEDEPKRSLITSKVCTIEDALKLLNECKILSWDGFHGPHPKHVLDGTMFTLTGNINGYSIYADGSQNFPKHFYEFRDGLHALVGE